MGHNETIMADSAALRGLQQPRSIEEAGGEMTAALGRASHFTRNAGELMAVAQAINLGFPESVRLEDIDLAHQVQYRLENPLGGSVLPQEMRTVLANYPSLRPPIIDGLLRQGETCNIIASPKVGKTMLAIGLSISVALGRPWLGLNTHQGDVLYIDNECQPETFAHRMASIVKEMDASAALDHMRLVSLRGCLDDIITLKPKLIEWAKNCNSKVIVLDALYRLLPNGASENDNATISQVYNCLDIIAKDSGASIIAIHHTSKGGQSEKSTTDVGSGAGVISRAADTHLILRQHEQDGQIVVDAVARSWPPMAPFVISRGDSFLWHLDGEADPSKLKGRRINGSSSAPVSLDTFLPRFLPAIPATVSEIHAACDLGEMRLGIGRIRGLLEMAVTQGKAVKEEGRRGAILYGREHTPESSKTTIHDSIRKYVADHPKASRAEIAAVFICSDRTVYRALAHLTHPTDRPDTSSACQIGLSVPPARTDITLSLPPPLRGEERGVSCQVETGVTGRLHKMEREPSSREDRFLSGEMSGEMAGTGQTQDSTDQEDDDGSIF